MFYAFTHVVAPRVVRYSEPERRGFQKTQRGLTDVSILEYIFERYYCIVILLLEILEKTLRKSTFNGTHNHETCVGFKTPAPGQRPTSKVCIMTPCSGLCTKLLLTLTFVCGGDDKFLRRALKYIIYVNNIST